MWLRLVEKTLRRLVGQHFCIIPRHKEGVLRDSVFAEVDFRDHEVVDKKHKLIVEKGKYKFVPRPSWIQTHPPDSSVQAIVDNSMDRLITFGKPTSWWRTIWSRPGRISTGRCLQRADPISMVCCGHWLGPGFVLKALASSGTAKELYGLDFSLSSIKRCREEVQAGRFMIGDIYHIACEDSAFDAVLCMETLEHLERPAEALCELFRICRTGGHVIMTIPNGALDEMSGT